MFQPIVVLTNSPDALVPASQLTGLPLVFDESRAMTTQCKRYFL